MTSALLPLLEPFPLPSGSSLLLGFGVWASLHRTTDKTGPSQDQSIRCVQQQGCDTKGGPSMLVAAILVVALAWHMLIFTLGYLIAGRALAMEVADLTIGLGPRITSFVLGNTHYDIRLVPLGASVRLADESPTLRLAVFSCAGPLLNMFAAGVLLTLIYMYSYQDRSHSTANAVVFAGEQSPAHNAGIYSGDSILQIASVS